MDEDEEWDRDEQYFHYLTKWMLALARASAATGDSQYVAWASEMAEGVHGRFTYSRGSSKRMYWKMSIDLSRPLVCVVSFPADFSPSVGKSTSGKLPIAFRFAVFQSLRASRIHC